MNYRSILQSDFNSLLVIFCILCAIFAVLIWFSVRSYKKNQINKHRVGQKSKEKAENINSSRLDKMVDLCCFDVIIANRFNGVFVY